MWARPEVMEGVFYCVGLDWQTLVPQTFQVAGPGAGDMNCVCARVCVCVYSVSRFQKKPYCYCNFTNTLLLYYDYYYIIIIMITD